MGRRGERLVSQVAPGREALVALTGWQAGAWLDLVGVQNRTEEGVWEAAVGLGAGGRERGVGTLGRGWSGESGLGVVSLGGAKPESGLGGDGCGATLGAGRKKGW